MRKSFTKSFGSGLFEPAAALPGIASRFHRYRLSPMCPASKCRR
jgi:hypothetical protein